MPKTVTPQPMPKTEKPDWTDPPKSPSMVPQRSGMTTDRPMPINPGRPAGGR
jgi:hypothetical protein